MISSLSTGSTPYFLDFDSAGCMTQQIQVLLNLFLGPGLLTLIVWQLVPSCGLTEIVRKDIVLQSGPLSQDLIAFCFLA